MISRTFESEHQYHTHFSAYPPHFREEGIHESSTRIFNSFARHVGYAPTFKVLRNTCPNHCLLYAVILAVFSFEELV